MRRLRWVFYRRGDGYGAHLAPQVGTRTLCNRSTRAFARRAFDDTGQVFKCEKCLALAGKCSVCGEPVDSHFDKTNRWIGCAHTMSEAT